MARLRNRTQRKGANGLNRFLLSCLFWSLATIAVIGIYNYGYVSAQRATPTPISQPPFCNITPEPWHPGELD